MSARLEARARQPISTDPGTAGLTLNATIPGRRFACVSDPLEMGERPQVSDGVVVLVRPAVRQSLAPNILQFIGPCKHGRLNLPSCMGTWAFLPMSCKDRNVLAPARLSGHVLPAVRINNVQAISSAQRHPLANF